MTVEATGAPARFWVGVQRAPLFAAAAAGASVACAVGSVVLHRSVAARVAGPVALTSADVVLAIAFPVVGAVIVARQRANWVGWWLLATCLMGPYLLAGQYAALSTADPKWGGAAAAWLAVWGYQPYFVLWALVPMHFPDGQLPSDRWRPVRACVLGVIALSTVARMLAPIDADVAKPVHNPLGIGSAGWLNVVTLGSAIVIVAGGGVAGVVAVVTRLRATVGVERRRLQWLAFGVAWLLVSNVVGVLLNGHGESSDAAFAAGMIGLIACIAVGAIRHQLFDIGTALSRTIVYTTLTGLLVLACAAIIAAAGNLEPSRRLALVVVAIVALVAAGARDQLQRLVDRAMFGQRQDPYAVLSALQRRIDLSTGPLDALSQLTSGLRDTLVLPYAAVYSVDARIAPITVGPPQTAVERVDAVEGGQLVGWLVVGRRTAAARFNRREHRALAGAAARAAELLRRAELTHDLQVHRQRLVLAREEERRRLRRDLHDGIGPELAAVAMQLDRLVTDLHSDAALAGRAARARDHLRGTVASVRHIVDGLRPSALDDMGLHEAVGRLVADYAPVARLEAGALPALPAAVEAAAYYIAGEGLTNAMRHSHCGACVVRIDVEGEWLSVTVADDGGGLPPNRVPGVGLNSIRDRASEVGGRLEITSAAGTTVRALLPLDLRT
ncbi:MAG TPA: ATP-binding protein [Jatrophihabitans sp.]|nr:ATP-binding protein [Jatrophihabitans sp.]